MANFRIGTSAFTAAGWAGTFYPPNLKPAEFLSYYATIYNTVELDTTLYGAPSKKTVEGWASKTPEGFIFTAKVPNVVTHERVLLNCDAEFTEFVKTMDSLGEKLGPLLLQFAYVNRKAFAGVDDFLARLRPFLKKLPSDHRFAVEIRNKSWLVPHFVQVLREAGVALTLIDQSWMPQPWQWSENLDPITADFTYVRWLGDRKGIEEQTKIWNKVIVDRSTDLAGWIELLAKLGERKIEIYGYANNHYAGYAPATVEAVRDLWRNKTGEEIAPGLVPQGPMQTELFK